MLEAHRRGIASMSVDRDDGFTTLAKALQADVLGEMDRRIEEVKTRIES